MFGEQTLRRVTAGIIAITAVAVIGGRFLNAGERDVDPELAALDPRILEGAAAKEATDRVRRVFPNGVAKQDAPAEIGTAPAPARRLDLDPTSTWVAEIDLGESRSASDVRTAAHGVYDLDVRGRERGTQRWGRIAGNEAAGAFDRVAVVVDLVTAHGAVLAADVAGVAQRAESFAKALGKGAPTTSMTPAQAEERGRQAVALGSHLGEGQTTVLVKVTAPSGARFPGRSVWETMYSASFSWGDGDYFHWLPSPEADVRQGISVSTTSGTGYFLPESLLTDSGDAYVDDLDLSFDSSCVAEPKQVLEVLFGAATHAARQLGGAVRAESGGELDRDALRKRVADVDAKMRAAHVVPGSALAMKALCLRAHAVRQE